MKKYLNGTKSAVVLFALAALLLGFGTVNAIQAAPRIESADYRAQVQLSDINVAIVENGNVLASNAELLTSFNADDFKIGQTYPEVLSVKNSPRPGEQSNGDGIPEYVRVTVYRYWTDAEGKAVDLDPSYIKLGFDTANGWIIDDAASTPERTVLYYAGSNGDEGIVPVDGVTPSFASTLTIDGAVATKMQDGQYLYDANSSVQFHIRVTADAVQTHNGEEAMKSAWGRTNTK